MQVMRGRRGRVYFLLSMVMPLAGLGAHDVAHATTFEQALPIPPVLTEQDITIEMKEADVQIFPAPAPKTRMWTYGGVFPGPTIRRPSGQPTRVTYVNQLPESVGEMTVHHHGNHSASSEDGQPAHELIPTGGKRTYTYEFMEGGEPERAAFQWYHDHRMDVTGRNVYMGLAGMFILDDPVEEALPLPKGEYDVPIMLTDRNFSPENQLEYEFNGGGVLGDTLLVNGVPTPHFEVADRKYRLRILNASNRREYGLELSTGEALVQIGTESGLLPVPVKRQRIVVGPAERVEIVVDFAGRLGEDITLKNTAEVVIGGPSDVPLPDIMQFRVRRHEEDTSSVPASLRPLPEFETPTVTRHWTLTAIPVVDKVIRPDNTDAPFWALWGINGLPFDHHRVDARPKLGSTERWVFRNISGLQHRIHIHDIDWRVVSRKGGLGFPFDPGDETAYEGETGLRETFLVDFGETVIVESTPFTDHLGIYMFHCHILEHEDSGMMSQFEVVP